jgi:lipopolysaccharide/colanic/teichoic acid biosynthesis glycosyltransferase
MENATAMRPTFYVRTGKRLFDVFVTSIALIAFAPLLVILAVLVRVFLGKPILFRQERPGLGTGTFTLIKFRTMTDARDASGQLLPDSDRLTRFGRFLRSTSLDELPELFNILCGEMSWVGPRPLLVKYLPYYTPRENTRHDVRPGLTGWAQIHGRSNLPWDERLELDAWYVENCSLRLDLKILWKTAFKVVRRENVVNDAPVRIDDFDRERRLRQMSTKLADDPDPAPLLVLTAEQADEWQAVLDRVRRYDFHHLPAYHDLAQRRREGIARLFVFRENDVTIALPLLLRPLAQEPWTLSCDPDAKDATSVYGYAGPIASRDDIDPAIVTRFRHALREALEELNVTTVFSRLHPLLPQTPLLEGLGECSTVGPTASIDLTLADDDMLAKMHRSHRQDVRLLAREGYELLIDDDLQHLDAFVEIYHENMRRVSATSDYFFPIDYFRAILADPTRAKLMFLVKDDALACGSIFLLANDIMQFHLSGTASDFLSPSPIKLLLTQAARWGRERDCRVLHLGGGLGGKEDSLFQFKARFSDRRHEFRVWRWIVDPARYQELCFRRMQLGGLGDEFDYFPAYRRPIPARPLTGAEARSQP